MGSVYVPPATGGSGAGGGNNDDATRFIQYNYVRNYMIAHLFSWPSYRYIYLQTIIFALAFLGIGIAHHFQVHERSVLGVRWSRWSTKNRVIKLGKKEEQQRQGQLRARPPLHLDEHGHIVSPYALAQDNSAPPPPTQPAVIDGVQPAFSYPPSATAAARARTKALDRATIYSMGDPGDDDHASIEGVRGDSFFTRVANAQRWLFSSTYRSALRDRRRARRHARAQAQRKRKVIEFPSFGRIIALFFVTAVPVILTFVGADYINPNSAVFDFRSSWMSKNDAYLYSIGGIARRQPVEWGRGVYPSITTNAPGVTLPYRDWWTAGNRVGDFAFALTPLVVLVALKQVPWALLSTKWMGGLAFDKLNFLHVWVGRLVWVFATAHVGAWSVQLARDQQYNQPMWNFIFWWIKFRWGIVAYIFLTLLMFLSLSPFRMDTYEWFYVAHVVCAFGFLLTSALHHPPLWPWMGAPLIWWALERAHRAYRVMRMNGIGVKRKPAAHVGNTRASPALRFAHHPQPFSQSDHMPNKGMPATGGYHQQGTSKVDHGNQHNYARKNSSVMTSSSLTSESTYVNSLNNTRVSLLNKAGTAPSSSSSTTPVNSPPLAGRRVMDPGGPGLTAGMAPGLTVVVIKEMSAEQMYIGRQGDTSYRPNLVANSAETDVADGVGGGVSPASETPPTAFGTGNVTGVGLHDGANQSQVHLLAPGAHTGATSTTHTPQRGLSPNTSMLDFASAPRSPGAASSFPGSPSFGPYPVSRTTQVRNVPRPALSPDVLAILKPGFAFAEVLPGQTVRLTLRTPSSLRWRPGQYVNLNIPGVAWWQSHPFTIASAYASSALDGGVESDEHTMVLIIRARLGFTLSLWEHICKLRYAQIEGAIQAGLLAHVPQKHQTGVQIRAIVDGPYGSTGRIHWGTHSTVMIICGGSGVSFGLSVLEHLCMSMLKHAEEARGEHGGVPASHTGGGMGGHRGTQQDRRAFLTRRIRFVWILREFVHLQWAASALRRCLQLVSPHQLQVDIFVTHFNDESHYERQLHSAQGGQMVSAAQHEVMRGKASASAGPQLTGAESYVGSTPGTHAPNAPPAGGYPMSALPSSASYSRAARFTEGPEQDEYDVQAVDLTNFEGEAEDVVLSKAEREMNARVQKEGRLRRAYTRKMSMRGGRGGAHGGAGRARGGASTADGRGRSDLGSQDAGYLGPAEMAAFSEAHGGAPVPSSEPLRSALHSQPARARNGSQPMSASAGTGAADASGAIETPIDLDEHEDEDLRVVAELARPGHPKLDRIVREECERSEGRVMISSCGPASLGTVLRSIATKQMDPDKVKAGDLRYHVNVVTESFDWGGT